MSDQDVAQNAAPEAPQHEIAQRRLRVVIATGERVVYDGHADALVAPSVSGEISVGARHAPLLALLDPGEVVIRLADKEQRLAIGGGFLEIREGRAMLMAGTAERAEEIDIARAEAARKRAEQALRRFRGRSEGSEEFRRLRRSRARLHVAGHLVSSRTGTGRSRS